MELRRINIPGEDMGTRLDTSLNGFRLKWLAIIFTCFVFMAAMLGNTPTLETRSKKAIVIVTVENFKHNEKKLEYKMYNSGTQEC